MLSAAQSEFLCAKTLLCMYNIATEQVQWYFRLKHIGGLCECVCVWVCNTLMFAFLLISSLQNFNKKYRHMDY